MLELVNLSNYTSDIELIQNSADYLEEFLHQHQLDGLEMMFCAPWDPNVHKKEWVQGVHLRFWPNWLDFWRGDKQELLRQFGSEEQVAACYGAVTREGWLNIYRGNIREAKLAGAKYVVFHVSQARIAEVFNWQFHFTDQQIIEATIEVVNALAADIPDNMEILFENLWWPGLTLADQELTALLLEKVKHPSVGIMLDSGHLMNTNQQLKTQEDGIKYILERIEGLGAYKHYIHGIHLHYSLSGEYIKRSREEQVAECTMNEVMNHVLKIDQHLPFSTPAVGKLIDYIKPRYLVHEFMYTSLEDWSQKIKIQQQALQVNKEKP